MRRTPLVVLFFPLALAFADTPPAADTPPVRFSRDVLPILEAGGLFPYARKAGML